jgi:RNA polymerase sigma factor (sigma-70 family)
LVAVPSIGRASLVEPRPVAAEAAATSGLYERHAAKIHGYCLHQLGSREEAEDAVQTTFMNAFRALRKGVVPEAEAAWLFKIAENVCLSRRRSSWRRNRIESPADFQVIEEVVAGPNRQRDELIGIEDALASMPEQQRRAILLREWQGLSYREIAEELELSQSAVETLIFRARRSLAQGLTEPESVKPQRKAQRKGLRRALHLLDLTTVLAVVKTVLTGSAAVKATTAAVAVTAIAGGAATVAPKLADHAPKGVPPVVAKSEAPPKPAVAAVAPVGIAPVAVERRVPAPAPAAQAPAPTTRPAAAPRAVAPKPKPVLPIAAAPVAVQTPAPPAAAVPPPTPAEPAAVPPQAAQPKADEPKQPGPKAEHPGRGSKEHGPKEKEPKVKPEPVRTPAIAKDDRRAEQSERKAAKEERKAEKGNGRGQQEQDAVPVVAAAPAATAAPAPVAEVVPAAEPAAEEQHGNGNGHGNGGKDKGREKK